MIIEIHDNVTDSVEILRDVVEVEIADFDISWQAIPKTVLEAKGDLITATAAGMPVRLAGAEDGDTIIRDSAEPGGWRFGAPGAASGFVQWTNKSGYTANPGDVVVFGVDAETFERTDTPADLRVCGVVQDTIYNNNVGKVWVGQGTIVNVNCTSDAVALYDFLASGNVAGQAKRVGPFWHPAAFAIALEAKAGGAAGQIKAMLLGNIQRGNVGIIGYVYGGAVAAAYDSTEGFSFSTLTWAGLPGSVLPLAIYEQAGASDGATHALMMGGTLATSSAYAMPYATQTWGAAPSANLSVARRRMGSGLNRSDKSYMVGGFAASSLSSAADKVTHATLIAAAISSLPAGIQNHGNLTSGIYCYTFSGGNPSTPQATRYKIDPTTDTPSTLSAGPYTADGQAGLSYPAVAGYTAETAKAAKMVFATEVMSTLASAPADNYRACGISDGVTQGVISGKDTSPYDTSSLFVVATETFSAAPGSALNTGRNRAAWAMNGAL